MVRCKTVFLVVALITSSLFGFAQQNKIIVWDITRSMIGVSCLTPPDFCVTESGNIDALVRQGIKDIINESKDANGEIRILTFRENVIDNEVFSMSADGRDKARKFVDGVKITKTMAGATNVCGAWGEAMKFEKPNQSNTIILFTDGHQSEKFGGKKRLDETMKKYCAETIGSDTYTFYCTLNLKDEKADCGNITSVPLDTKGGIKITLPLTVKPWPSSMEINLSEGVKGKIKFKRTIGKIPDDLKIVAELILDSVNGEPTLEVSDKVVITKKGQQDLIAEISLTDFRDTTLESYKSDPELNLTGKVVFEFMGTNVSEKHVEITLRVINDVQASVTIYPGKRMSKKKINE